MTNLEKLEEMKYDFWTRLNELIEDVEEAGFEVVEANNEYLTVAIEEDCEDAQYELRLFGERTIKVESIEEVYRG